MFFYVYLFITVVLNIYYYYYLSFVHAFMDYESASKFISTIHNITAQQQFLIGIQEMISRRGGTPTHMFDENLDCLSKLKERVREFQHISDRESGRKLRREWIERERGRQVTVDVNWSCILHKFGCNLE